MAQVLQKYPLGLAEEACNPQRGVVLKIEFLSLKSLYEWCEERKADYTEIVLRRTALPAIEAPSDPTMAARVSALFKQLGDALRAKGPSPLDRMHEEVAEARKLRIQEVMRRAYEQPAKGDAAA